jgi:hypothetical protein
MFLPPSPKKHSGFCGVKRLLTKERILNVRQRSMRLCVRQRFFVRKFQDENPRLMRMMLIKGTCKTYQKGRAL